MPGEALRRPTILLAVVVLLVNDHWLKHHLGTRPVAGAVTGKLSDVAGLVFFPLLLVSALELARWAVRGRAGGAWAYSHGELTAAVMVTGLGFAAVQVLPVAGAAYADGLAVLRWLPSGVVAALAGAPSPPLPGIDHVMDASDSLCLPALWWAHRVGRRVRLGAGGGGEPDEGHGSMGSMRWTAERGTVATGVGSGR